MNHRCTCNECMLGNKIIKKKTKYKCLISTPAHTHTHTCNNNNTRKYCYAVSINGEWKQELHVEENYLQKNTFKKNSLQEEEKEQKLTVNTRKKIAWHIYRKKKKIYTLQEYKK